MRKHLVVKLTLWMFLVGMPQFTFGKSVIKSFDGFPLAAEVEIPNGAMGKDVKRVIVLVHGSGPQSLDVDLGPVTVPSGSQNLYFKDLAGALRRQGFTTIRYDKRSYEFKTRIEKDPKVKDSNDLKRYSQRPLDYTIRDAEHFAKFATRSFPKAAVYMLGHSEGTRVVLEVAKRNAFIKGVVLIGFSNESLATSVFEQTVYRPLSYFEELDKDRNGFLDAGELGSESPVSKSILGQMGTLDLDLDAKLSQDEFKAGNYSNLHLMDGLYNSGYALDEAKLARPSVLIREAKYKILFLQGEWDNQTPSYFARSIEIVNRLHWKKPNLEFRYFAKAGHALDPRASRDDLSYRRVPPADLDLQVGHVRGVFP